MTLLDRDHDALPDAAADSRDVVDTRAICPAREILARHDGLADLAFTMRGVGSGAISLAGTREQNQRYLPGIVSGDALAAFALSETGAGSDVAAMTCTAPPDGDEFVIDGDKTRISDGGIADFYLLFARTGGAPCSHAISAFIVDAGTPGYGIAERIEAIALRPTRTGR